MRSAIAARRTVVRVRVILPLDPSDVDAIDAWAESADMDTRAGAIRRLIRLGLKAERAGREG